MFSLILKTLGGTFIDGFLDKASDLFKAYLNKEITKEQLRTQLLQTLVTSAAEVEKAHAASLASTFASFMDAAKTSRLMQGVWAAAAISQLVVLLWHQAGIPAVTFFFDVKYPSSGTTVEWAYALLMFCLGGGAIALRVGPGKVDLKSIAGVK